MVAKSGKLIAAYKRAGHRVIINKLGDLIVRPNPLEASLQVFALQGSVRQHLLTSYLDSVVAVMLTRFSKSKAHGPMARIVTIVKNNKPLEVRLFIAYFPGRDSKPLLCKRSLLLSCNFHWPFQSKQHWLCNEELINNNHKFANNFCCYRVYRANALLQHPM